MGDEIRCVICGQWISDPADTTGAMDQPMHHDCKDMYTCYDCDEPILEGEPARYHSNLGWIHRRCIERRQAGLEDRAEARRKGED